MKNRLFFYFYLGSEMVNEIKFECLSVANDSVAYNCVYKWLRTVR